MRRCSKNNGWPWRRLYADNNTIIGRIVLAMVWLGELDLGDWDYWGDAWLGTRQQNRSRSKHAEALVTMMLQVTAELSELHLAKTVPEGETWRRSTVELLMVTWM